MDTNFAENLYRLRRENGLTQEQLANMLGVSFQSVSKWENKQGYPDIELLPRIASYFHITLDALLGYRSEKEQEFAQCTDCNLNAVCFRT